MRKEQTFVLEVNKGHDTVVVLKNKVVCSKRQRETMWRRDLSDTIKISTILILLTVINPLTGRTREDKHSLKILRKEITACKKIDNIYPDNTKTYYSKLERGWTLGDEIYTIKGNGEVWSYSQPCQYCTCYETYHGRIGERYRYRDIDIEYESTPMLEKKNLVIYKGEKGSRVMRYVLYKHGGESLNSY